jgi:hypothetical protein
MLASTVQFSKYGRSQPQSHREPRTHHQTVPTGPYDAKLVLTEETRQKPVPSGPNSVPGHPTTQPQRPSHTNAGVLTMPSPVKKPNNQCSTMSYHTRNAIPGTALDRSHHQPGGRLPAAP